MSLTLEQVAAKVAYEVLHRIRAFDDDDVDGPAAVLAEIYGRVGIPVSPKLRGMTARELRVHSNSKLERLASGEKV